MVTAAPAMASGSGRWRASAQDESAGDAGGGHREHSGRHVRAQHSGIPTG